MWYCSPTLSLSLSIVFHSFTLNKFTMHPNCQHKTDLWRTRQQQTMTELKEPASSDPPKEIWSLILKHVPLQDRIGSRLVSSTFSTCVTTETTDISASFEAGQQERLESLEKYLELYGSHLDSLQVQSQTRGTLFERLPTPNLKSLDISSSGVPVRVTLGPHNDLPGVLDSLKDSLTCLQLSSCQLVTPTGRTHALEDLSSLRNLKHMQLYDVCREGYWAGSRFFTGSGCATLPGETVANLTKLTCLDVETIIFQDLHAISSLSNLTKLRVEDLRDRPVILVPAISPSGFTLPSTLRDLSLARGYLDPAVLSSASHLTRLNLWKIDIAGHDRSLPDGGGGAGFLAAVGGLQELEVLKLHEFTITWPDASAAYASLTASPNLTELSCESCRVMPTAAAWEFAFPAEAPLSALKRLKVNKWSDAAIWHLEAVTKLVRRCPSLEDLELDIVAAAASALEPLAPALTRLKLSFERDDAAGAAAAAANAALNSLAALTGLHELHVYGGRFERAAASPLTALTRLTQVHIGAYDKGGWIENKVRPPLKEGCQLVSGLCRVTTNTHMLLSLANT